MKLSFIRIASALIAAGIVCTALASCGANDAETDKETDASVQTAVDGESTDAATETKTSEAEPAAPVVTPRYAMSNGQWGQLAEYKYNERGQLESVTTVSPFTLAPLCYERVNLDRAYSYSEDGRLERVYGYREVFELTYSPDGLTAEGKHGDYSAKLTFSDKKMLVREEYFSTLDSFINEYDADGNIVRITQGTGFVTTHTYSDGKVEIAITKADGKKIGEYAITFKGDDPIEISAQGERIGFTYENGLRTRGDYNGKKYEMSYDGEGRVISTKTYGDFETTENFSYDAEGRLSVYTREYKTALSARWEHEKTTVTYAYSSDGMPAGITYLFVSYDNLGNETSRREEEY